MEYRRSFRTLVVVPTLLGGEAELLEQIEQLEVHYLTGTRGDLSFALLADGIDARQSVLERDVRLLKPGAAAIERLNRRHVPARRAAFLLLYRQRRFNPQERRWIGWERKRGKLHELNRLLRGRDRHQLRQPRRVRDRRCLPRFVITLDADTRLPRETLRRLIGKMAHPLNQPLFEAATQRVVSGYAILQPRLRRHCRLAEKARFISGCSPDRVEWIHMQPRSRMSTRDLFGEGSYTGKGIYDVDAFEAAMAGRIGENSVLSHDLFEGIFARAGLASDVEVVEGSAGALDVVAQRLHRWTRGDWQLLPWIIGHWRGEWAVPWSAAARCSTTCAVRCLRLPPRSRCCFPGCCRCLRRCSAACYWLGAWHSRPVLPVCLGLWPRRRGIGLRHHFSAWAAELRRALLQTLLSLAFLADQAWRWLGDAIVPDVAADVRHSSPSARVDHLRAVGGETASRVGYQLSTDGWRYLPDTWRGGTGAVFAAVLLALGVPFMLPLGTGAGLGGIQQSSAAAVEAQGPGAGGGNGAAFDPRDRLGDSSKPLSAPRITGYRRTISRTSQGPWWHRTSPTNIGLYLLSAVAARDFGWAGTQETP